MSFWNQVQAGNPLNLQAPNPNYIGNFWLRGGLNRTWTVRPDYKTPGSLQMNIGIQREIRHGMVFSADYLRNVETRTLLGRCQSVGDVRNFNLPARRPRSQPPMRVRLCARWTARSPRARAWSITRPTGWVSNRCGGVGCAQSRPQPADLGIPALLAGVTRLKRRCFPFPGRALRI